MRRLLIESNHAIGLVNAEDAESTRVSQRYLERRERRVSVSLQMEAQHLRIVHLVHVIARQHDDVARRLTVDGVEVLEHGIGRAEIPVLSDPLLRWQDLDELAELLGDDVPSHPDVAVEREGFVLRRDEDATETRVDAVAQ